ncbi:methyltransferase domain-containing protein [Candidatus Atribacteria bacterium 1244-E10-H5-B2]|nr:MAG: methyltransferase domain-containing protein [Candidatus Atribacteria bacterium 1244-E10-H5-B2]
MQEFLIEMLECPSCHGELNWKIIQHQGDRIEEAEVNCKKCDGTYPVKEGIGLFLTPDLPRNDLWEQLDSQLIQCLRENPQIESKLMDVPLNTLNPADQFFRSQVLEERGEFAQAKATANFAYSKLYAPEYLKCYNAQINYLITQLSIFDGPIIDIASGRGDLAELLVRKLKQPIVFTDFSPQILRRNRRWLEFFGLYERVSLLAFDARRSPFKDGAIKMMTTNLGLINIEKPENLLNELRRIVSGKFFAISSFYPEDDEVNVETIKKLGVDQFLFRNSTLESFYSAGWQVRMENMMIGKACPTPKGEVIEGAGIDAFPVTETKLEWGILEAQ